MLDISENYISRYRSLYNNEVALRLKEEFSLENVMNIPRIEKISLNVCCSQAVTDSKKLNKIKNELSLIAGQLPVITKARCSVAGFHLREGMPIGAKVTLRKNNMYDFLDKLINIAMPRIKDFSVYSMKNFDHNANFNFGLTDQTIFPEINYDAIEFIWGMNVTIVTSVDCKNKARRLLECFNFPFSKKA